MAPPIEGKIKNKFKTRIYQYVISLIKFLAAIPNNLVTIEIKKQLIRSSTSIGANYFEAEAASSKKDFQNFFRISLKSANESKFWLIILKDSGFLPKILFSEHGYLFQETQEIAKILAASILTMKGKR